MKQKDIALIAGVVIVSVIFALIVTNIFISSPKNRKTPVEVVDAINSEFNTPNPRYFNKYSIDPTKNIRIGDNDNTDPFSGSN